MFLVFYDNRGKKNFNFAPIESFASEIRQKLNTELFNNRNTKKKYIFFTDQAIYHTINKKIYQKNHFEMLISGYKMICYFIKQPS